MADYPLSCVSVFEKCEVSSTLAVGDAGGTYLQYCDIRCTYPQVGSLGGPTLHPTLTDWDQVRSSTASDASDAPYSTATTCRCQLRAVCFLSIGLCRPLPGLSRLHCSTTTRLSVLTATFSPLVPDRHYAIFAPAYYPGFDVPIAPAIATIFVLQIQTLFLLLH